MAGGGRGGRSRSRSRGECESNGASLQVTALGDPAAAVADASAREGTIVADAEATCHARRRITGKRCGQSAFAPTDNSRHTLSIARPSGPAPSPGRQLWPIDAVVINLDRRPDRWEGAKARLAPLESSGCLRVRRFSATDGSSRDKLSTVPDSAVAREWTTDRNAKYDGRPGARPGVRLAMSPGERGCAMSHVRVWREVAAGQTCGEGASAAAAAGASWESPTIVLEDDAVIGKRFKKRVQAALHAATRGGADAVYLGYIKGAPWRGRIDDGLFEAEYLWTTVGYILWPHGARKLLSALPVDQPVDNFMAWLMATRRFRAFAMAPPLVDQQDEWDCGSDVAHSDDAVIGE